MERITLDKIDRVYNFDTGYADFQITDDILRRGRETSYGMFEQACLEFRSRYGSIAKERIALEEMQEKASDLVGLERFKLDTEIKEHIHSIKRREREAGKFYEIAIFLGETNGYFNATPEEIERLRADMWIQRMKTEAACQLISNGRVSESTVMHIRNIEPARKVILPMLISRSGKALLIKDFIETMPYELPSDMPKVDFSQEKVLSIVSKQLK